MYKTLKDIKNIIKDDLDLWEEKFISEDEIVQKINDAQKDAYIKIQNIHEDYFLDYDFIPLHKGEKFYDLPFNIFANKIRRIIYTKPNKYLDYEINRFSDISATYNYKDNYKTKYRYMLINGKDKGVKLRLYPMAYEDSNFYILKNYTEQFIELFNKHISDSNVHTTSPDTENIIENVNIYDKYTLFYFLNLLKDNYIKHHKDAELSMLWRYHIGQYIYDGTNDASIHNTSEIYDIKGAIDFINNFIIAYNNHIHSDTSHAIIDLYRIEVNKIGYGDYPDIVVYYIRQVKELKNDDDILDIPEFYNYIVNKAKLYLLEKDIGNPMIDLVGAFVKEQEELLLESLSNRIDDNFNSIYIRHDPYNDSLVYGSNTGNVNDPYNGMIW